MTLHYPDVSSAQAGMSLAGAVAVCAKITQGRGYLNPAYANFKAQAAAQRAVFFGYHFLEQGNAHDQAAFCRGHAGPVPLMVDCEPTELAHGVMSRPTLSDLLGFIDVFRGLGGVMHLGYLPRWVWAAWGSPSLAPLAARGMTLVSSDYVPYSDSGPGWAAYGGMKPGIWQWSESAHWNGRVVDRNAFKGTRAQLASLVATGSTAPPKPAAPAVQEDEIMDQLRDGAGAETIISFLCGSKKWIALGCDASRTHAPAPVLRIAAHSKSKGMSQVQTFTMPVSGKHTFTFTAKDVDFLSVVRSGGNPGDQVAVGYNLG